MGYEKQVRELANSDRSGSLRDPILLGLILDARPRKIHAMGIDQGKTVFHC
jgi:hypothetical protein